MESNILRMLLMNWPVPVQNNLELQWNMTRFGTALVLVPVPVHILELLEDPTMNVLGVHRCPTS